MPGSRWSSYYARCNGLYLFFTCNDGDIYLFTTEMHGFHTETMTSIIIRICISSWFKSVTVASETIYITEELIYKASIYYKESPFS